MKKILKLVKPENLTLNSEVYSIARGNGKVTRISIESDYSYPLTVEFEEGNVETYTETGRLYRDDKFPCLFAGHIPDEYTESIELTYETPEMEGDTDQLS